MVGYRTWRYAAQLILVGKPLGLRRLVTFSTLAFLAAQAHATP